MKTHLPRNIDWMAISYNHPLKEAGITLEGLFYIVGHIYESILFKDLDFETPVNLNATVLKGIIPNSKQHVDYLINNNIIELRTSYSPSEFARGYVINPELTGGVRKGLIVNEKIIKKHYRFLNRLRAKTFDNFPFLTKWFDAKLTINYDQAIQLYNQYIDSNLYSAEQLTSYKMTIEKINDGDFFYLSDSTSGRFASNITTIKREFRDMLLWDSKTLSCCDLKSSQCYMLAVLLELKLYENEELLNKILKCSNKGTKAKIRTAIEDAKTALHQCRPTDYKALIESGRLYEEFMALYNISCVNRGLEPIQDYDAFKKKFLMMFYYQNYYGSSSIDLLRELFSEKFRDVYMVLFHLKRRAHEALPILLTCIERYYFLDEMAGQYSELNKDTVLFSVHDSLVTIKEKSEDLKLFMEDYLLTNTGVKPIIKLKDWQPLTI